MKKKIKDRRYFFAHNTYGFIVDAKLSNTEVYLADPQRQHSGVDCSIFSFNDIKQFFKNDHFFEQLNQHGDVVANDADPHLHHLRNLPPLNMKLAQSWKALDHYLSEDDPSKTNGYLADPHSPRKPRTIANLACKIHADKTRRD